MSGIGENIRKLRLQRGWTQEELAGLVGTGKNYIGAWENGRRKPGDKLVEKLSEAFGVDELTIRFGEREEPKTIDPDLQLLQDEVARLFEVVKADSPLKKHHFMVEVLGKLKALGEEGRSV